MLVFGDKSKAFILDGRTKFKRATVIYSNRVVSVIYANHELPIAFEFNALQIRVEKVVGDHSAKSYQNSYGTMNDQDDLVRLYGLDSAPAQIHSVTREECDENDPQAKLHYQTSRETVLTSLRKEMGVLQNLLSKDEKTAPTVDGEQLCVEDWQSVNDLFVELSVTANIAEILVLEGSNLLSDCSRLQKGGRTSIATNPLVSTVSVVNTLDSYRSWLKDEACDDDDKVAGGTLLFSEEALDFQTTIEDPVENVHSFRNAELNKMLKHIHVLEQDCSPSSNITDEKTAQQKWTSYLNYGVPQFSSNFNRTRDHTQAVPESRQISNHEERFQPLGRHASRESEKATASGSGQITNIDTEGCSKNESGYATSSGNYRDLTQAVSAPEHVRNNSSVSNLVVGMESEIEQQEDYDDDDDEQESSIGPLDDNGSLKEASGEGRSKSFGGRHGKSSSSSSSSFFGNKKLGSILSDNGAVFDLPVASFNTFPNHFSCQSHGEQSFREDTSQEIEKEINSDFIRANRHQGSTRQREHRKHHLKPYSVTPTSTTTK